MIMERCELGSMEHCNSEERRKKKKRDFLWNFINSTPFLVELNLS